MRSSTLANPERGDARLLRTAAVTFIAAAAIVALYFGQEVLIPVAVAMLLAFILGPAVSAVRRLLPLPLAVAAVVLGALVVAALVTMLIMNQLAEVAGSLTGYQANLHQKIQDIRGLSEGRRPVEPLRFNGRFAGARPRSDYGTGGGPGGAGAERRVQLRERRGVRGAPNAPTADPRHRGDLSRFYPARPRSSQR